MRLMSEAFSNQQIIPIKYTCDGANISPPLAWEFVPKRAQSLVLVMEDPDAPVGTWVHWLLYNIPVEARTLPAGVPTLENLPRGMQQGKNSFYKAGYGGPCPPPGHGPHRYFFRLYALDTTLKLRPGATRIELDEAMRDHILSRAELMGRFERRVVRNKVL